LCPPDQTFDVFLSTPEHCLAELHKNEHDNLFLITHYQHLNDVFEHGLENIQADIAVQIEAEQALLRDIEAEATPKRVLDDLAAAKQPQEEEDPLVQLEKQVKKTYKGCFGVSADLGAMLMLEKIENELEVMYEKCDRVVPDFLIYKRTMRERQRRDHQRKQWQEWRAKEQQRKIEQAISRARRPIPHRTARPLTLRTLPLKARKQNDEAIQRRMREQLEEERLLYRDSDHKF
jgi:hypothetical protein